MENYKIKDILLESIFPSCCVACKKQTYREPKINRWLCLECEKRQKTSFKTICHVCGKEAGFLEQITCAHSLTFLKNVSFLFDYTDKNIRALVHALKYRYVRDIAKNFSAFMAGERLNLLRIPADIIIPLPLHKRKLRERGFNQAELLGLELSRIVARPLVLDALKKVRPTLAQMKIKTPRERKRNVQGAFKVTDEEQVKDKNVLLIDDVITTGATLEEAAKTLIEAGAKNVYGFVLARD